MTAHYKLGGEYRFVMTRADGSVTYTGWFKNIITDLGLDQLGSQTVNPLAYCRIGTGTSTPDATQQALDAQVASTNTVTSSVATNDGSPNYTFSMTLGYVFAQGAVVGNMAEIGVGPSSSGNNLFSRARILDGVGSPTTITVTSLDQLTVYYRVRMVPPLSDVTGSVVISGITYNYTARVAGVTGFGSGGVFTEGRFGKLDTIRTYTGGLGAITGFPSGADGNSSGTRVQAAYTPGSFYRDTTFTFAPSEGNATGGIKTWRISGENSDGNNMSFQYEFDTPIPKDNTKTLSITVRVSWSRV